MNPHNFGLNVIGYTEAMSGLGEAVRLNIKAAETHNIPLNLIDYERVKHEKKYKYSFKYSINLVQISLYDLDRFFSVIDTDFFDGKYNILFLIWESEYIPEKLKKNVNLFNEVWTASTYCKNLFQKVFHGHILTVPHPVEVHLKPYQNSNTPSLLDKNKFSFLFIFSYHSSIARKNPFFLIEAFSKAFDSTDRVELLIKTTGAEKFKKLHAQLNRSVFNKKNIKIVNLDMDKNQVNHLINDCNCYVSMHHSEGFGLTLAEAMYLGKPTVATNYSGNTEFMNENNSYLVDYELGSIENPDVNFCSRTVWANPIMEDAVLQLRNVYDNAELRLEKALNAKQFIEQKLSFYSVGSIMKDRLNLIYKNLDDIITTNSRSTYLLHELQLSKSEAAQLQRQIRRMKKNLIIRFILALKNMVRQLKGKR
jgi:glycosyltransferase involved in cell wall biosynthesis